MTSNWRNWEDTKMSLENSSRMKFPPQCTNHLPKKKPIIPSSKELNENLPSRSAKLRYVIKTENFYNLETDIFEKFKKLIEIENLGNKL